MILTEKIEMLMTRHGVTPKEMEAILGIDLSSISRLRGGKRSLKLAEGIALARRFGVTLDYLMDDERDEPDERLRPDERKVLEFYRQFRDADSMDVAAAFKSFLATYGPDGVQVGDRSRVIEEQSVPPSRKKGAV